MRRTPKVKALPKSPEELAALLRKELKLGDLDTELWAHLTRERFVAGAIEPIPSPGGIRDCLQAAKKYLSRHPDAAPAPRVAEQKPVPIPKRLLSEAHTARAKFFSDYIAQVARERDSLSQLRSELGLPVPPETAFAWLRSPAVQFLHREFFLDRKIPIVGHRAKVCLPDGSRAISWDHHVVIRIEWNGRVHDEPYKEEWFLHKEALKAIAIPSRFGDPIRREVSWYSVLNNVRALSVDLSQAFPWPEEEAVWFIVTDSVPLIGPIRVRTHGTESMHFAHGRITMEIEPWLPAETVRAIYQDTQRKHFRDPGRPCLPERLELFKFVEELPERTRTGGPPMASMEAWKKTKCGRRYTDYTQFRRDYFRAARWIEREVLEPEFQMFEPFRARGKRKPESESESESSVDALTTDE